MAFKPQREVRMNVKLFKLGIENNDRVILKLNTLAIVDQVKSQLLNLFLSIKLHTTIDWAHIHLSTCCKFELGYCTERSNQCHLTKVICNMIFFFFKASYNKVLNGTFCYFNDIFGTKIL